MTGSIPLEPFGVGSARSARSPVRASHSAAIDRLTVVPFSASNM
jgi:hypothetical protein